LGKGKGVLLDAGEGGKGWEGGGRELWMPHAVMLQRGHARRLLREGAGAGWLW
jgi:hypothetical protein